jgi:glycosyltransferase involved in cell wall biosynthesis
VVPCLNEEAAIGQLVAGLHSHLKQVLVVDDGSADRTAAIARAAGAQVLVHKQSRGKGVALRAGWAEACRLGFPWALSLDGDGQHSPQDIPEFFKCADQTGASLVVGNRMNDAASMPWLRRRVNLWMSRRISNIAGAILPDTQCGFRLMRLVSWSAIPVSAEHFEIESDVLLAFLAAGHRVEFVPIHTIYKDEQSKIHPLSDTVRWFKWWQEARRSKSDTRRSGQ